MDTGDVLRGILSNEVTIPMSSDDLACTETVFQTVEEVVEVSDTLPTESDSTSAHSRGHKRGVATDSNVSLPAGSAASSSPVRTGVAGAVLSSPDVQTVSPLNKCDVSIPRKVSDVVLGKRNVLSAAQGGGTRTRSQKAKLANMSGVCISHV